MRVRVRLRPLGLLSLGLGFGLGSLGTAVVPAAAQGAPGAEAARAAPGDDIVVTARRREERLQDVPVAVSAFGLETLEQLQILRTENLAAAVPSLYINRISASPSALVVFLRGAGEQVGGLATSESPVGIYVDDVYFARLASASFDLAEAERIEVLRGPQGTLYGRNTMTGALKITTRRPTGSPFVRAEAGWGRFDRVRLNATASAPVTDGLAVLATVGFTDADGWFDNLGTDPRRGDRRTWNTRATLATTGSGPISARVSGFWAKDTNDGITPAPVNPAPPFERLAGGFRTTRSPVPAYGENRQWGVTADIAADLSDTWTLKSITGWIETRDRWGLDFSGGFRNASGTIVAGFFRQSETRQRQLSQELQLQGELADGAARVTFGGYVFDEKAEQTLADSFGVGVFGPFPVSLLPSSFDLDTKSRALFAQAEIRLADGLTATLGGRYSWEKKRFSGLIQNGLGFPPAYAPPVSRQLDEGEFTPRFGLDWRISPDVLAYASIARGFKAGGFNGLAVANPTIFGAPYDAESVWAYEAGVKSDLLDRRLRLNLAWFWNDLRDIQQNVVVGGGSTQTQNAARARLTGLEAETSLAVTDTLRLFGMLSLLFDRYLELDPASQAAIAGATRLPLVSRVQSQLGASWRQPVSDSVDLLATLDWSHRSSRFSEAANLPLGRIGPVDRVNLVAGASFGDGRWELTANVRNLLNADDDYSGLSLIPGLIAVRFFEEPRTYQMILRYRFGG
ncbi:TonB-dependent receptor [Thermaurantiacus tibetensis]|uniref:TonB-dependent receptor n=1 Tax=Thermaurantiacus tibetensis TaxID=2759035 RepID=UPI00188ECE45|nr:TonB-dependent receptor [Thermaurantiacus tibetensis]